MSPAAENLTALTPAPSAASNPNAARRLPASHSLLVTRIHPPSSVGNVAWPSGAGGHTYSLEPTGAPLRAMTRLVNPSGSTNPLASGSRPSSGPYGPGPGTAGSANTEFQNVEPSPSAAPAATADPRKRRRSMGRVRVVMRWTVRRPHVAQLAPGSTQGDSEMTIRRRGL